MNRNEMERLLSKQLQLLEKQSAKAALDQADHQLVELTDAMLRVLDFYRNKVGFEHAKAK